MVSAIQGVSAKRGFLVVIGESGRDTEGERRYVEHFLRLRIGGIVITPVTSQLDHLREARARGIPVVVMARRWEDGNSVATDGVKGGQAVPKRPVGEMSAELLFDRIQRVSPAELRQILLPPELVVRDSCP